LPKALENYNIAITTEFPSLMFATPLLSPGAMANAKVRAKRDSLIRVIGFFWSTETAVLNPGLAACRILSQAIPFSSKNRSGQDVPVFL